MFISKFDLYNNEWLELVFHNRNKTYGAYDLRKHYTQNLYKAFGIALVALAGAVVIPYVVLRDGPLEGKSATKTIPVDMNYKPIIVGKRLAKHSLGHTTIITISGYKNRHKYLQGNKTHVHVPTGRVSPVNLPENVVSGTAVPETTTAIKPETSAFPNGIKNIQIPVEDADVMPEPYGGADTWTKYLQNNIIYPDVAWKNGITGKVWVSFVVEKDGHISNIVVTRGAGFGFDQEAVRVIKMAPVWKPGTQNGQTVRVKYTMPINFRIEK